jgi:hypothetical protein
MELCVVMCPDRGHRLISEPVKRSWCTGFLHKETMLPITGPFSASWQWLDQYNNGDNYAGAYKSQAKYRQVRPFDRPLAYRMFKSNVISNITCSSTSIYSVWNTLAYAMCAPIDWNNPHVASAYNKAYSKFLSKIKGDQAELGASMGEFRKTADMVSDRTSQLYKFFRALRRGRFREANALIRVPSGFKPKARSFGGIVLEYSFGWAPVVSDIHTSMKVLVSGIPPSFAKAKVASVIAGYNYDSGGVWPLHGSKTVDSGYITVNIGAGVHLTNPNLWLANQLGIINPVSVAWELTRLSFLVDYFINVSQVIDSWSDLIGVEIFYPYRSYGLNITSTDYQETGYSEPWSSCHGDNTIYVCHAEAMRFVRELSIPGPSLRFEAQRVSLKRASTSISLLLQQLKGR